MKGADLPVLSSIPAGGVAAVFGARGGIGAALMEALAASGGFECVLGYGRASAPPIDLLDEATIARAAVDIAARGEIRLVIDATGFLHDAQQQPERRLDDLDASALARAFAINAIGPALIMKHLLPRLPRTGKAVFATLSARVGSIGDNRLGGWYSYRASKAALNQLTRTAALELARRHPQAICVALHPGTVDTPLSRAFTKRDLEVQTPAAAAAKLLAVIDGLDASCNGGFFDHHGAAVPW